MNFYEIKICCIFVWKLLGWGYFDHDNAFLGDGIWRCNREIFAGKGTEIFSIFFVENREIFIREGRVGVLRFSLFFVRKIDKLSYEGVLRFFQYFRQKIDKFSYGGGGLFRCFQFFCWKIDKFSYEKVMRFFSVFSSKIQQILITGGGGYSDVFNFFVEKSTNCHTGGGGGNYWDFFIEKSRNCHMGGEGGYWEFFNFLVKNSNFVSRTLTRIRQCENGSRLRSRIRGWYIVVAAPWRKYGEWLPVNVTPTITFHDFSSKRIKRTYIKSLW